MLTKLLLLSLSLSLFRSPLSISVFVFPPVSFSLIQANVLGITVDMISAHARNRIQNYKDCFLDPLSSHTQANFRVLLRLLPTLEQLRDVAAASNNTTAAAGVSAEKEYARRASEVISACVCRAVAVHYQLVCTRADNALEMSMQDCMLGVSNAERLLLVRDTLTLQGCVCVCV